MSETVTFEEDIAWDMSWEEWAPEGFEWVAREFDYQGDWSVQYLNVIRRVSDGKLFGTIVERPSCESDSDGFETPNEYHEVDWFPSKTYYLKRA